MSVRVFFTTAYVACSLMVWRSLVSWATVSPRYSVSTAALELWNFSVSSATAAALSGLAMGLLPRVWTSTGGWADPTTRNAPARGARGGVRRRHCGVEAAGTSGGGCPYHLRGSPHGAGFRTLATGADVDQRSWAVPAYGPLDVRTKSPPPPRSPPPRHTTPLVCRFVATRAADSGGERNTGGVEGFGQ